MSMFGTAETAIGAVVDPGKLVAVVVLIIFAFVCLTCLVLLLKFHKLWLQAKLSRADVKYAELVGMWLRHSDYRTIVLCRITAVQGGLNLSTQELESHHLAGGRVANVVRAMIAAKRKNVDLSWENATAIDLDGRDICAEVQSATDGQTGLEAEWQLRVGDVGEAVSALEPAGEARFGDVLVEVVAKDHTIDAGRNVEIVAVVVKAAEN
ncbi:MAG: flotillin-like FloA family protein [Planctomycetota bacterium]|jgi:hypothetical protein